MKKVIAKILFYFSILVCLISVGRVDTKVKVETVVQKEYIFIPRIVHRHSVDTFYKTPNGAFKSIDDYVSFIKYIKTQSGRLDRDNWAVMQVINNRMNKKECTWMDYYSKPSLNHSHSIKLMRSGRLNKSFKFSDSSDIEMLSRAIRVSFDEPEFKIEENVLAFESFKVCPNRGVHLRKNLAFKYRHKFYYMY